LIEQTSANENQDRAYRLAERMHGAAGVLALAQRDIESRHFKNADASVDSELSMLWWDQDMYRQSGMLPNPLYYGMTAEAPSLTMMPLLMVGRIDAPSLDLAKKIVEQSIAAEKNGLDGKVYVDARGLAASGAGDEPARWDQKLVDFGWFMRKHSPYSVEIDKYPPLLAEAADAAVYTGWYSLRNFSGDFSFVPGAIGYHIASEEAVSIHNSEEKGWCRNLLLRGITATLGAVAEPYLEAFPLPQDFIGLLMTGRYSLVEAYYMSVPHVSWRMVLIGDPLYNPWRGKALVEASELEIKRGAKMLDTAPVPPAEIPIGDPPAAIRQIRQNRKAAIVEIDNYFKRLDKPAQGTKTRS
ncbi:MAG TPA: TIGR03790 family protein, partial [Oligoflexia bacterium]|nr:TIGR03790 family protein [Oligoflexia bacterium]